MTRLEIHDETNRQNADSLPPNQNEPRSSLRRVLRVHGMPVIGAPHPQREAFFEHCYDCHDDLAAKGGLDLTALPTDLTDPDTLAKWTLVDRVRNGEMPPEDKPQPKSRTATVLLRISATTAGRRTGNRNRTR